MFKILFITAAVGIKFAARFPTHRTSNTKRCLYCVFAAECASERILKTVTIWRRYGQDYSVCVFWLTVYILDYLWLRWHCRTLLLLYISCVYAG